jgi:hypothetical protein
VTSCTSTTGLAGSGNAATATCSITVPKVGTYVVSDTYNGDTNYAVVTSATDTVTPSRFTPTVAVNDNHPSVSTGGTLIYTATVTGPVGGPTPTGAPTWTITGGAASCTGGSTGPTGSSNVGTYTCSISSVKASSTYSATFNVATDTNYNAASGTDNAVTVSKVAPTNVVTNGAAPSLGGSVTFTATMTGPTGGPTPTGTPNWTITGSSGAGACTSSTALAGSGNTATATCTITASKAGTYVASDTYNGDTNYSVISSTNDSVTVGAYTPAVAVTNNAVSTGGTLVFTATVTGPANAATPTGTPTWTITGGVTSCTGGSAGPTGGSNVATYTCSITGAKAALTYSASFSYPGDGNYTTVSGTTDNNVVVPKNLPTNVLSSGLASGTLTFTALVTGQTGGPTPTGTLTWAVSGSALSCNSTTGPTGASNVATYTCAITGTNPSKSYNVTATYPGDANYTTVISNTLSGVRG